MFVDKEHVMLEAGIEMGLKAKLYNRRVMVTINMSIYPIKPLEELANESGKGFRKWST